MPFHPGRFWVHCRAVYLPMGYIYGRRLSTDINPLIESLRQELYSQPYDTINWAQARDDVSNADLYTPRTKTLTLVNCKLIFLRLYCNYINYINFFL